MNFRRKWVKFFKYTWLYNSTCENRLSSEILKSAAENYTL